MTSIGALAVGLLVPAASAPEPLPVDPPIGGLVWGIVVPAALFAIALGATVMLYRHFSSRDRS